MMSPFGKSYCVSRAQVMLSSGRGMSGDRGVVVLGIGNPMRRDEGVGVRVVERLRAHYRFPDSVRLIVGGIRGIGLVDHFSPDVHVVLVDAILAPYAPGTLIRLTGEEVVETATRPLAVHQAGAAELLTWARALGRWPASLVVWGMVPACVDLGSELSPPVAAQLDALVAAVAREVHALSGG